jgi:hypothetical protein
MQIERGFIANAHWNADSSPKKDGPRSVVSDFLEMAKRYERLAEIEEAHADAPLQRRDRLL